MQGLDTDMKMRVYILDSLVAKSGAVLTPSVIGELTTEILARMIEVNEVPLFTLEDFKGPKND